jgi:Helicase conserved C-terminal domain
LDRPWFNAALRHRGQKFVDALGQAVFDGNLESVLDEHLWVERTLNPPAKADELAEKLLLALSRVRGWARFQHLGQPLRCHAAVPFTTTSVAAEPEAGEGLAPRPDEIRRGFNSPFWPHVLTTTSVGQEGLDFHYWCRTVVHWDLCSSPVELEQREGRVQRFAGLNVRQAIAGTARSLGVNLKAGASPWKQLEQWAEQNLADESGLCPWWLHQNAETESLVFETPGSDQTFRRERLQQRRLRYRLTLGQPNQADLLELLTQDESLTTDRIQQALLNLSAYSSSREASGSDLNL